MASYWDLLPAGAWPTQPFVPPYDPMQTHWAVDTTPASPPRRDLQMPWERAPVFSPYPTSQYGAGAQTSPPESYSAPDVADPARYQRMADEAKRTYDAAMWAFGPPNVPQTPSMRQAPAPLYRAAQPAAATGAPGPSVPGVDDTTSAPWSLPTVTAPAGPADAPPMPHDLQVPWNWRTTALPVFAAHRDATASPTGPQAEQVPFADDGQQPRAAGGAPAPLPGLLSRIGSAAYNYLKWNMMGSPGFTPGEIIKGTYDWATLPAREPVHWPADSFIDDSGQILLERDGKMVPWRDVDPVASRAFEEDLIARANWGPQAALALLGLGRVPGGAPAGAIGSFKGQPPPRPPNPPVEPVARRPVEPIRGQGGPAAAADQAASPRAVAAAARSAQPAPKSILDNANFAQNWFDEKFSDNGPFAGRFIDDLVKDLNSNALQPSDIPIHYIVRDGNILIANTRSSEVLRRADIPRSEWKPVNKTGEDLFEDALSKQLEKNGLTSKGTPVAVKRADWLAAGNPLWPKKPR